MERTTPKKFMRIADTLAAKGYRVGHQLGEGTYSKVRTVERVADRKMCAVKIIDRQKARKDYLTKFLPRELEIIKRIKHKNVIQTFMCIETKEFIFQIMQYAEKGDVLQMIHSHGFIAEVKSKNIFNDVMNGLKYLHDLNIAHRDLKCENILIFKNNVAALTDFGFARSFDTSSSGLMCRTFCGSAAYASPELLRGIPYDPRVNDIWGTGVILYTMLCGTMPFEDANVTRLVQQQLSRDIKFPPRVSSKISENCKKLIFEILDPSITKRPNVDHILSTKWLRDDAIEKSS
ncbi:testis-specific serine/threonine-protein kinase 1-like [Ruditapes philippinarum]|uniref:testis-specific serine/threonine-protein kinase 1-like n=1 Tax=Ruditapes philippinarum TaxID=129788 RepID=UPI00295BD227|nr:testis-specific serine/threonine-protein kinase 1-like [Ruditapes philippinarum]